MTRHIPQPLLDHIAALPPALQRHTERTRSVARELATAHGLDVGRADLGAMAHDMLRATPARELLAMAQAMELPLNPVEEAHPVLLHGPVAARLLSLQFGISDPGILESVRWHSTARPDLSQLGLVVFLADKLDPHKIRHHPDRQRIKQVALVDLERATLEYLNQEVARYLCNGALIHPASVDARNYLILRLPATP